MSALIVRFRRDGRGSVALMFALAMVVLIGAIGAAMDYSRAASVQSNLQRAVDGAALQAAKNSDQMAGTMSDAAATEYVKKTFVSERITDVSAKVTFFTERVRVDASAQVPTTLMNVLGIRVMPVSVFSEVQYRTRAEIVLVLDNTGSMNDLNKLPTLKQAATNFVRKMQETASSPDAVRIGIVPFETDVNLGALKSSWWVDSAQTAFWTANPTKAGCIWDRDQPNDAKDTPPSFGVPSTLFSPDQTRNAACTITPIVPLTNDFPALEAAIGSMNAVGTTNLTIGLTWGYHLLSPSEPITNALPFSTKSLAKYIVLMTDGKNTKMRGTTDVVVMDARTRQACDAIKAEKIIVFTARIIDGNDTLLRDCASSDEYFYPISDVAQLDPAFKKIYDAITGARITR